ncbi:branched-chain amino acid transport system substrate-binding protein [Natronospira proteinivora]|uniref:Branched-chain amino acid transport system substrate-binding protein n=1 Tax=Natronospira proteinivora TaxID=1807133 RepID=A0ABT1G7C6_9GAMM|nr:amino acid ABC transporter substrate-binding protein [Natronospira proteinivora]MCP1727200.1 branched-chain amino acid transport system substrate-binding protein [Natronospira proteinivora]
MPLKRYWIVLLTSMALTCTAGAETTVRIGASMSESGDYATQGTAAANGYRLCETHLNEAGGILGRPVEFIIQDDESSSDRAQEIYQSLIKEEQVDAVMGPYGSTLTEAVAPVTEEHELVHISPLAATTSIWEQGRDYLFMVLPPAELFLAGLIDMADEKGVKRIAILEESQLFPQAAGAGAEELAIDRGMEVVFREAYPSGKEDFGDVMDMLKSGEVEVLAMAASNLDDFIRVTEALKVADVNLTMFGTSGAVDEYQEALGADAEYHYGLSAWEPSLPNPGIDDFVKSYEARFDRRPSFHAAGGYGSCQLFAKAVEKAGTLDQDKVRDALLELETTTVFGPYAVDERGYQTANQGVFIQWQDGEKVVVWPSPLADSEARFPTPE